MKKNFLATFFGIVLIFGLALSFDKRNVQAAPYGAKLYTTPKAIRGDWYYQKGKNIMESGLSPKFLHAYRRIKIEKHTIIFYRKKGKKALNGKYTFYEPKGRYTVKNMIPAERYATKHKWLAPSNTGKKFMSFRSTWLHTYEESNSGELRALSKNKLKFGNLYINDYFVKK